MKKIFLFLFIAAVPFLSFKRPNSATEIKWMTWKEMQEAQQKQPRKVFVDVYTDWCGWCKRMDATTFTNPEVVKFINDNYYAIKFDAETREVINFKGRDFKYVPSGYRGYNELAAEILNGQLSYPTGVYLDEKMDVIFPVPGYQDAKLFEQVIHFVHSNSYKTTNFEDFAKTFKGKVQ